MAVEASFSSDAPALTVEAARAVVFLWLTARQRGVQFTLASGEGDWKQDLVWLGLDWDGKANAEQLPEWARSLPPIQESTPSPHGQWSGRTPVAELRELGVLPEALLNFLAMQGWQVPHEEEVRSRDALLASWPPRKGAPQPVVFDFAQLARISHAWIERADPERLLELALPYYARTGWLPGDELPSDIHRWMRRVVAAVQPGIDFLSLFPPRTRLVFDYKPEHYLKIPESREAMERTGARDVLRAFGQRALAESWLTPERFREVVEVVKQETGFSGRALWQPIRVALTGLPFGPEVDELVLIFERGHELDLPVEVKSCRQRVLEFCSIFV